MSFVKVVILINQAVPSFTLCAANRGQSLEKKKEGTEIRSVFFFCISTCYLYSKAIECMKYVLQIAIFSAPYKML